MVYGNMDPINISPMLAYIAAPWILWDISYQYTPDGPVKSDGPIESHRTLLRHPLRGIDKGRGPLRHHAARLAPGHWLPGTHRDLTAQPGPPGRFRTGGIYCAARSEWNPQNLRDFMEFHGISWNFMDFNGI